MAETAPPAPLPPQPAPPTREAPQPAAPGAAPGPARDAVDALGNAAFGKLADGGFLARLGPGIRLTAADMKSKAGLDLSTLPQPVPGLRLVNAKWSRHNNRLDIAAKIAVPHLDAADITIKVDSKGKASLTARRPLAIAALGNPVVTVSLTDEGQLSGSVIIKAADLTPRGLRSLTVTGGGTLSLLDGHLAGTVDATLAYANLGTGEAHFATDDKGTITGAGKIEVTPPFLGALTADLALGPDGNLAGSATVTMTEAKSPIPALSLTGGTLSVAYANGAISGALSEFQAEYKGLASVTASAEIKNASFTGQGKLDLTVPGLKEATGTIRVSKGTVSGSMTLVAKSFPEGLPVKSGQITATLSEAGRIAFAGKVGVTLGPAGKGDLTAAYSETGELAIAATIALSIPGLQTAQVSVAYVNGDLSGEAQVAIDPALIPGLEGNATVRYQQGLWSGETEIAYSADDGKLAGRIRVTVAQTADGKLQLGGTGEVEAQIAPRLRGMLTATILPEGGVDVSGRITVTEPLELFPEARFDKELFKYAQNIPLWAILVAVIRVRAGVRGGIGPGVFRNITVDGSYTIGSTDADPSFSISGELFIPAFIEGYVAFGAGLGLDVVLGELTGGIEGVATAGIYGAVSVIPTLSYADGDWMIEGDATLAAGARLKIGLNAWAEVEALWVTVWDETWKLGEWVWNIGPDLGLKAHMEYHFGKPEPPTLDFTTSDIDTESMIQAAMPDDGPAPSGAKEALENKAEWKGLLREKKPAPIPPDLAAKSQAPPPTPPQPAQPKPKAKGPPPGTKADQATPSKAAGASIGASGPATASPKPDPAPANAVRVDRPTAFLQEQHVLRAVGTAAGLQILMASDRFTPVDDEIAHIRHNFVGKHFPGVNPGEELDSLGPELDAIAAEKAKFVAAYNAAPDAQKEQVVNAGMDHFKAVLGKVSEKLIRLLGPWTQVRVGDTVAYQQAGSTSFATVTRIMFPIDIGPVRSFGLKARPAEENPAGRAVSKSRRVSPQSSGVVEAPGAVLLQYKDYGTRWERATGNQPLMPGSQQRPFKLAWPKPPWHRYPTLYFGSAGPPTTQDVLRKRMGVDPAVQAFTPAGGTLATGKAIGLDPAYRIDVGSIVGPLSSNTTPGGRIMLDILRPLGFDSDADGIQIDHVHETQLGGPNVIGNLWPLPTAVNASAGSTLAQSDATLPDDSGTVKLSDLKRLSGTAFYFRITSVK